MNADSERGNKTSELKLMCTPASAKTGKLGDRKASNLFASTFFARFPLNN